MRLSLVVPCYNEEKRLDVPAFRAARLEGHALELVFVDDGSKDGTRAVLEGLRAERPGDVRVVAYDKNAGKAEAVRRGLVDALGRSPDAVGFWDADLATPLFELPGFLEVLRTRPEVDIVIGSRVKLMGRSIERQAWRHYMGRLFATASSMALALPVYDTQCGAKVFRATELTRKVMADPFLAKWVFDVEIIARYAKYAGEDGYVHRALYELPLRQWIDVRGSKLKASDFARAAVDLARIHQTYR
jgi:glycosyltransferase involved in cell wall biosynthesis